MTVSGGGGGASRGRGRGRARRSGGGGLAARLAPTPAGPGGGAPPPPAHHGRLNQAGVQPPRRRLQPRPESRRVREVVRLILSEPCVQGVGPSGAQALVPAGGRFVPFGCVRLGRSSLRQRLNCHDTCCLQHKQHLFMRDPLLRPLKHAPGHTLGPNPGQTRSSAGQTHRMHISTASSISSSSVIASDKWAPACTAATSSCEGVRDGPGAL
jgi:hypothetical protein